MFSKELTTKFINQQSQLISNENAEKDQKQNKTNETTMSSRSQVDEEQVRLELNQDVKLTKSKCVLS